MISSEKNTLQVETEIVIKINFIRIYNFLSAIRSTTIVLITYLDQ